MLKTRAQSQYILNTDNQDQILVNDVGDLQVLHGNLILAQNPTLGSHAVTKSYVDSVAVGLSVKENCQVLSADNINIALAPAEIDGYTLKNKDRIFVVGQIFAPQNGIYIFSSAGAPLVRASDANSATSINNGMYALVTEGDIYARTGWILVTDNPITVDVTSLTFVQFTGAGSLSAGTGLVFTGNQIAVRTGHPDRITADPDGLDLAITGVTPGSYNGFLVDDYGRVVTATEQNYLQSNQTITVTGDATGSGNTAIDLTLIDTGVESGNWNGISVDSKGRITALTSDVFLTDNQTITISGDITGTGQTSIIATLEDTGVIANLYGNATTVASFVVDSKGRITTATDQSIAFPVDSVAGKYGDVELTSSDVGLSNVLNSPQVINTSGVPSISAGTTASRPGAALVGRLYVSTDTLSIARDNGGSWEILRPAVAGDVVIPANTGNSTLSTTGITAGTYTKLSVDSKGRAFLGSNITSSDVKTYLGYTPLNKAGDTITGTFGVTVGSTTAPSIYFGSSTASGLFSGNVDEISIVTANNDRLKVNSFGKVLINATDNGVDLLQVNGSISVVGTPYMDQQVATKKYVDDQVAAKDNTDEIVEGYNNLYFTTVRARTSISAGGNLSYNSTTGVMSYSTPNTNGIAEGSNNLYFTTARARATLSAQGNGLSYDSTTGIISSNATNANAGSTIVYRDVSGNFSAGIITASLSGNASTAGNLISSRLIAATGDASWQVSFNGSSNVSAALTLANTSVTAGTYGGGSTFSQLVVDSKGRITSASDIALTSGHITTALGYTPLNRAGDTMAGALVVLAPSESNHAATKEYVDTALYGLSNITAKTPASCTTTGSNITLSGLQTIDGYTTQAGDRVLVKDQTNAYDNGVYVASASTWTRSTDLDSSAEMVTGVYMPVLYGSIYSAYSFVLTTPAPIILGTTNLSFGIFLSAPTVSAGAGLTKNYSEINVGTASSSRIVVNADNIDLATTGVSAGTYNTVTVDAYGRVNTASNAAYLLGNQTITLTGDISGSGSTSIATVLGITGVTAGTYGDATSVPRFTVSPQGRITAVTNTNITYPVTTVAGKSGAVVLTSSDVSLGNVVNSLQVINAGNTPSIAQGAASTRPLFGSAGRLWYSTDIKSLYRDNGTGWDLIQPAITGDIAVAAGGTSAVLATVNSNIGSFNTVTVNAKGLVTGASNTAYITGNQLITVTGDATGSGSTGISLVLADVNTTIGQFGTTTSVPQLTVNSKGLVTQVGNLSIAYPVSSVAGRTGAVTLAKADVGLGNVANSLQVINAGNAVSVAVDTTVNRPAAGTLGRIFIDTTVNTLYRDTGSTWQVIQPAITGDITISAGGTSATLAASGVSSGTYNTVTVDTKGRVTAGSNTSYLTGNQTVTLSGDVTGSGSTSITSTLSATGVSAGTYNSVTVDTKGRVISGSIVSVTETSTLENVVSRGATSTYAISITNGTASTSTITGALKVSGGVGIGGNLWVGGTVNGSGSGLTSVNASTITASDYSTNTALYPVWATAEGAGTKTLGVATSISFNSNAGSLSLVNSLTVTGSAVTSIVPSSFTDATESSSTTTGALKVTGGVGVAKNLYVGGNTVITGNLTVNGTTTTLNTATLSVADNIVTLNSDYTSGVPSENAGIEVRRGAQATTALRWLEQGSSGKWQLTNDGTTYSDIRFGSALINIATETTGNYVAGITAGTAISVTGSGSNGATVTINNTGVTSNVAGTGITVSGATGAVTITNSGVTSITATTPIVASAASGAITLTHANSGASAGTYGSGTAIPVIAVNASGHITGLSTTAVTALTTVQAVDSDSGYSWSATGTSAAGTNLRMISGSGIDVDVDTANVALRVTNTDKGSSQSIFKNIADSGGTTQFSAGSNSDSLRFAASGIAGVSFNSGTKTVTISATESDTLSSVTGRGNSTGSAISITNATAASSTSTGALVLAGGVGAQAYSYFAGLGSTAKITPRMTGVSLGTGNSGQLEINNAGSGACNITFHREGVYGAHFGLDTDNWFSTFGWSAGSGYTNMRHGALDARGDVTSTGEITAYSDIRLKTNIELIPDALGKVLQLRGVTFTRIDSGIHATGLIAQEVQKVLPQAVKEAPEGDILTVNYGSMVGLLVESIKELKSELDAVKAELAELRGK